MSSGLIGRESEVADLRGLLAGAGPRFVLVEGEAGIGKTALVRAVADAAPRVRWSHGAEDGGPALSLWRQLTPEVDPEGSGDRFALRAALRDVLGDCLLVIDDVQWADEASLSLLRGLLRDPGCRGLVCCATRRSGEAGAGWARIGPELTGGPAADRLGLGGLSDPAAAALVRAHGRALDEGEVERAVRAGGGNPLFLRELARAPGDRGSVGELIAARVRRLGPPAQRLLRAASLLAEDAELTVVSRLLDESVLGCLPAVDAALSAGLLTDSGGGRFRFAHGLVRTVLAAQTPLQEAVVLHLRAAEALEDLHRDGLAEVSADIARHRVAVAVTGDRAPAVAWARRAAADATRALAHEEAARWYATEPTDVASDANPPMPEFRDDYVLQEVDADWLSRAVKPKQFIHIDQSECIMCEGCVDICPWKCIFMVSPSAIAEAIGTERPGSDPSDHVIFTIDDDVCTRCALCVDRCPTGVIILGKVGAAPASGDPHQRTNTYGYGYGMRLG